MHAVGRRTIHVVGIRIVAHRPHRHIQCQRIARAASVSIRSHNRHGAERLDRFSESRQALGAVAVVIGKKDLHYLSSLRALAGVSRTILDPWAKSAYPTAMPKMTRRPWRSARRCAMSSRWPLNQHAT